MNITVVAISITIGLIGVAGVVSVIAGIKSLMNGKQDIKMIVSLIIPFGVFAITYGVMGTLADAGIATMFAMIALMAVVTLLSGLKSTFNL